MERFNYIAWVDNVCQKFEDVCLEVDNIRPEDIIGAAETQLQTMGASITKFFSDLVDDDVPQYSADRVVGEEASDLSPVQKSGVMAHKGSEVSMDDGHCEKESFFGVHFLRSCHLSSRKHLDPHLKQNDGGAVHENSRMIIGGNPIKEKENQLESLDIHEKKDSVTTTLSSPLDDDAESSDILEKKDSITPASSPPLDNTERLDILEKKDSVVKTVSSPLAISTENLDIPEKKDSVMEALSSPLEISTENLDILEKKYPVMEALSLALDDNTESNSLIGEGEGSLYSNSSTLMGSRDSEILDIEVALNVALAESTGGSVDDVRKVELETIQPSNKAKLDESCIMVDSSELCAVSGDVRRSGSDKKKSRPKSIFALRKKAQDWKCDHSHLDVGWYQQKGKGLAAYYDKSELLDDGFSESEWEII
ncbi:hypothetical protein HS088_TW21G01321 [Tripterygium wilfordii]|uniref:Uncharacterized protein n=1 Tax=Tripterygium wilfordii TaxID=458696 RepID=A0A7J7C4W1_TRIWF|nr:uncharacterized protein LOC119990127 [Tripterygium wilfordii]KAF5729163.1 hypothetical protein HS088_TW21G01321 [Tripterygium wilfordii]